MIVILKTLIFILALLGGALLLGVTLPRFSVKAKIRAGADRIRQLRPKRKEAAKEYVDRVNGKARENPLLKSRREAQQVYELTGQQQRFGKMLKLALLTGAGGTALGLILRNPMLSIVLAVGFYFLPLWWSQFSLFRYNKFLNDELETALSLITTSYTRNNDLLGAVEENLKHIQEPVKGVFTSFCNNLNYVDPNAAAQLERMKTALDNKLFRQWCDAVILCQDDHTLRNTLPPLVSKFSDQKAQQQENETKMMLPLRRAVQMIGLVLGFIPLLRFANAEWYVNLVDTSFGQLSLVATAVLVLVTINKAIRLSTPVEFDV